MAVMGKYFTHESFDGLLDCTVNRVMLMYLACHEDGVTLSKL